MTATALPPATEDRHAASAAGLPVVRGACLLALALLASLAILLALDAGLEFSLTTRCLLQLLWLAGAIVLAWRVVIQPWQQGNAGSGEARSVGVLAAVTIAAWLAALTALITIPGSSERLQRIVLPWYREVVVAPYQIVVTSGDPTVRRGGPVTLSAYAEPMSPGAALPAEAAVVVREPGGAETQVPMIFDGAAAFHATLDAVHSDFEYRVVAGTAQSAWHTVRVADPVEIADSSTVVVTAPSYAAGTIATRTQAIHAPIDALQYSTAALRLRFTRPASTAALEWRPEGQVRDFESTPVELSPDRTEGEAQFRLTESGTLVVVLVNELDAGKLRTETPIRVHVRPDAPPRFVQASGITSRSRQVAPSAKLAVTVVLTDDVGIESAVLEYATEAAKETGAVTIPLSRAGAGRVEGRIEFDLDGKATIGETIRVRVRIRDSRRIEQGKLGTQEATYPFTGWEQLILVDSPSPLDHQEIFARRDAIRDGLLKSHGEIRQIIEDVRSLRAETAGRTPLPLDLAIRLRAARGRGGKAIELLLESAREADLAPGLDRLATDLRAVTDRHLPEANSAIARAASDHPSERDAALTSAASHYAIALESIETAIGQNERLARDLLDRRRIEDLARQQEAVIARTRVPDTAREDLLESQQKLLGQLNRLVAESEGLSRGVQAAAARQVVALAAETRALAMLVQELDAAADRLEADVRASIHGELIRTQKDLADRASVLDRANATASRLARITLPPAEDFRRIADLIAADQAVDAMIEMEKLARALDVAAAAFDAWSDEWVDAKAAARHLARWQEDLRERLAGATKDIPYQSLSAETRTAFLGEQAALVHSTGRLPVPAGTEIGALRETALVHLRLAAKQLGGDGAGAEPAMKLAVEALSRLSEKLPPTAERLARALPELQGLRGEQESIITAAESIVRTYEQLPPDAAVQQGLAKKLAAVQARQEKLVESLGLLDLPGLETRVARCRAALKTAAEDLKKGTSYDITAALAAARAELERLEVAADKRTPTDESVEMLARTQRGVALRLASLRDQPNADERAILAATQSDVARQIAALSAPGAATVLADAREAVAAIEAGFKERLGADELARRARIAETALAGLADRLNQREPPREQVQRLAGRRRDAANLAKKIAGKSYSPDASSRENRRLRQEVEELTFIRVGAKGQPIKKRILDLYTRLLAKSEPDRDAAMLGQLAGALDELAAVMKDDADLTTGQVAVARAGADLAEAFIPSHSKADALRELARHQRGLRQRASEVESEIARRTRPAADNALALLEQRQRILTEAIDGFSRRLVADGNSRSAEESNKAAEAARHAGYRLKFGQTRLARESGEIAAGRLRTLASGTAAWSKTARELAVRQESLLAELTGLLESPAAASAQIVGQVDGLSRRCQELANTIEQAATHYLPGDPLAGALDESNKLVRRAAKRLADGAAAAREGNPVGGNRSRSEGESLLDEAAKKMEKAGGAMAANAPPEITSGEEIRRAEAAMREAISLLGANDKLAAVHAAMRQAKDALDLALEAIDRWLKPEGIFSPRSDLRREGEDFPVGSSRSWISQSRTLAIPCLILARKIARPARCDGPTRRPAPAILIPVS